MTDVKRWLRSGPYMTTRTFLVLFLLLSTVLLLVSVASIMLVSANRHRINEAHRQQAALKQQQHDLKQQQHDLKQQQHDLAEQQAAIQRSRLHSCTLTYEGIRQTFRPFFPKADDPSTPRNELQDVRRFNAQIDKLRDRCKQQVQPKPSKP